MNGKTVNELFQMNTKELASRGLGCIKQANVDTALIVTISFAVVLTHPVGYSQENGFPIFMKQKLILGIHVNQWNFVVEFIVFFFGVTFDNHISFSYACTAYKDYSWSYRIFIVNCVPGGCLCLCCLLYFPLL